MNLFLRLCAAPGPIFKQWELDTQAMIANNIAKATEELLLVFENLGLSIVLHYYNCYSLHLGHM